MRTAMALGVATESERADFASIALAELAVSYQAEADLARHESMQAGAGRKLGSWSAAVYGFVDQLVLVQEDIELGFPVELRHLYGQVIGVVSGGRTVILSHPRSELQPAFERRVLSDFCGQHDCDRLTSVIDGAEPQPIPVTTAGVSPQWNFSNAGPVCSHKGISVQFANTIQLAKRKAICLQLMQEAESLAGELTWQQRHGVEIDWQQLTIRSTPGRPEHIVQLNRTGDSILVPLPLLSSTAGLLGQLTPWLKTRYVGGQEPTITSFDAGELGWE